MSFREMSGREEMNILKGQETIEEKRMIEGIDNIEIRRTDKLTEGKENRKSQKRKEKIRTDRDPETIKARTRTRENKKTERKIVSKIRRKKTERDHTLPRHNQKIKNTKNDLHHPKILTSPKPIKRKNVNSHLEVKKKPEFRLRKL